MHYYFYIRHRRVDDVNDFFVIFVQVFIHKGEVHIVDSDRTNESITVRDALAYMISCPSATLALRKIQQDILKKVEGLVTS